MAAPQAKAPFKQTIALVDDDRDTLTSVQAILEDEGFGVRAYTDGESALHGITVRPVDLAVLDVSMPHLDGMELLRRLRQRSLVPVIFVTAKDREVDHLMGLRVGADDYITKPFRRHLLVERIRALLRRTELGRSEGAGGGPHGVTVRGALTLDGSKHECTWHGENIKLTLAEFLLVSALAAHPGRVQSRDQLIDVVHRENMSIFDRSVDSHIKRIRLKFRKVDGSFDRIETLYGVGYRFKES